MAAARFLANIPPAALGWGDVTGDGVALLRPAFAEPTAGEAAGAASAAGAGEG